MAWCVEPGVVVVVVVTGWGGGGFVDLFCSALNSLLPCLGKDTLLLHLKGSYYEFDFEFGCILANS